MEGKLPVSERVIWVLIGLAFVFSLVFFWPLAVAVLLFGLWVKNKNKKTT